MCFCCTKTLAERGNVPLLELPAALPRMAARGWLRCRMARPKKDSTQRRGHPVGVRLNVPERARIAFSAAAYGIPTSQFMRTRSLNQRLPSTVAEAHSLNVRATALIKLGNNLNQIAKHMNAGRAAPLAKLNDLIDRINEALDALYDPGPDKRRS